MRTPAGAPSPGRDPGDGRRARYDRQAFRDPSRQVGPRPRPEGLAEPLAPARTGRRGGGGAGRGGRSGDREQQFRRRRIAAVALLGGGLVFLWFFMSLFQPFGGDGEGKQNVTIPEGAGLSEIAGVLESEDVISSSFFFQLRARLSGGSEDLKAGDYTLKRGMSHAAALQALTVAPASTDVTSVTLPEGQARSEVSPLVQDVGLEGDYEQATESSSALDPADYGAEGAESLEGFLFPATYELEPKSTVDDLVKQQLRAFEDEFAKVDLTQAKRANLTPYDVLIIASMVEREAMLSKERPVVASVIYNRLSDGIPLGIDATIRFATENWTEPLTQSELAIDSPYNTRLNSGLPPGPIGNPGIDSIEAAANPDETDFLYYVVKPGTCGEHVFTETDAEFQAAVDEYNSERAAAGGQSPTDC